MALSVTGQQVESVLRESLCQQGNEIQNPLRESGETGADIIAHKEGIHVFIECIGFQEHPPTRSKQFYEAFFRAISRLKEGAHKCVIAVPARFKRGMPARSRQYGKAWHGEGLERPSQNWKSGLWKPKETHTNRISGMIAIIPEYQI